MHEQWTGIYAFLAVAALVALGFWAAGRLLAVRARVRAPLQAETYECGEPPVGRAWMQFHSRYYVAALVFVLFDVEAAFLFPWAVESRGAGVAWAASGLTFVAVLMLGWLYAVRKGALEWR